MLVESAACSRGSRKEKVLDVLVIELRDALIEELNHDTRFFRVLLSLVHDRENQRFGVL